MKRRLAVWSAQTCCLESGGWSAISSLKNYSSIKTSEDILMGPSGQNLFMTLS